MTLLEIEDLTVSFGSLQAVRGVSLTLQEGEILGIVGESGCGKSSLAKAVVRLVPPTSTISGKIKYCGKDLISFSEREMQKVRGKEIGMIFQDPMTSLNPTLKIGKQIIEGSRRHFPKLSYKEAYEEMLETLHLVGISDPKSRAEEYPHTLSGGMRQRSMIALALSSKPKLLLADEPTTALDVTIQAQILDMLRRIQKQTKTGIILITHDLSVIAGFCDTVAVMYAGKIVETAPTPLLFKEPSHPYTRRLLQAIPRLDRPKNHPLLPIDGSPPNLSSPPKGCSFCSRCDVPMRICTMEPPPLYSVKEGHLASCFHFDPRKGSC